LALIGRPDVIFLDEPTAGVDPQGRIAIRNVIGELRSVGACVLLTTHELGEAERLADRVIIIDRGRVVAAGSLRDLTSRGAGIRFSAPADLDTAALADHLHAPVAAQSPGAYRVDAPGSPATVAALTAWLAEHDLPIGDLRAGGETLEELFLRLTTHDVTAADLTTDDVTAADVTAADVTEADVGAPDVEQR
jgi:ABC-2 type transport system ATP-binding protein